MEMSWENAFDIILVIRFQLLEQGCVFCWVILSGFVQVYMLGVGYVGFKTLYGVEEVFGNRVVIGVVLVCG